jgi:hypothetical protein
MGEWVGWLASALVLATFCMRAMVPLRLVAIASNLAFIAYGASAGIHPVLMLHLVLLPLNALRLAQAGLDRCLQCPACLPSSRTATTAKPPSAS